MKFVIALFGAPRDIRTKLAEQLQAEFSKPSCSVHDFETPIKDAARSLFGLPSDVLAWHPEKWSSRESLYYGKTIEQIFKATYKFATALDESVLVDRVWDETQGQAKECPYCIIRDGRTIKEWELLQKKRTIGNVLIGVLVKSGSKSPFKEDEFDLVVTIEDADQDLKEIVDKIVSWTYEVHGAAESS